MKIFRAAGKPHQSLCALSYPQLALICDMLVMFQPTDDYEEVRHHELLEYLETKRDWLAPKDREVAA